MKLFARTIYLPHFQTGSFILLKSGFVCKYIAGFLGDKPHHILARLKSPCDVFDESKFQASNPRSRFKHSPPRDGMIDGAPVRRPLPGQLFQGCLRKQPHTFKLPPCSRSIKSSMADHTLYRRRVDRLDQQCVQRKCRFLSGGSRSTRRVSKRARDTR